MCVNEQVSAPHPQLLVIYAAIEKQHDSSRFEVNAKSQMTGPRADPSSFDLLLDLTLPGMILSLFSRMP